MKFVGKGLPEEIIIKRTSPLIILVKKSIDWLILSQDIPLPLIQIKTLLKAYLASLTAEYI